jgi:hypothetical protein
MKNGKIKESFILALETKMCNCQTVAATLNETGKFQNAI